MSDDERELAAQRPKRAASSPIHDPEKRPCLSLNTSSSIEEVEETLTMEALSQEIREMRIVMTNMENNIVSRLNAELKAVKDEVNTLKQTIKDKDETIDKLQKRIDEIEKRRDDNEQHNRLNNIRINGIPEKQGENCEELVMKVANCIDANIDIEDIDRAHRTGKVEPNKTRSIIVRFNKFKARKNMTMSKKKLKEPEVHEKMKTVFEGYDLGDEPQMFISDDLTKSKSALAAGVRQKRRADKIKETWISYGKIYAKLLDDKVVIINNKSDLDSLP